MIWKKYWIHLKWTTEQKLYAVIFGAFVFLFSFWWIFGSRLLWPDSLKAHEETLASQLNNIADSLNSLSRERETLAVSLARRGEFLHSMISSGEYTFKTLDEEEKFVGKLLAKEVESFPFIEGAGLYYEPFTFSKNEKFRGFYAHWVPPVGMSRKVEFTMQKSNAQADYQNSAWYRSLIPNGWNTGKHLYTDSTWSEPYRDSLTLVPIVSVLVAMYGEDAKLIGLSSIDWNLDSLTEVIDASRPTKNSIAALFSPTTKKFAAVAGLQGLSLEPIDKASWMPFLLFNAPSDRYEMVKGYDGEGHEIRVYSRLLENGMIYGVVVPEHEIVASSNLLYARYTSFLLTGMLCAAFVLCFVSRLMVKDLPLLARRAQEYARGDVNESVTAQGIGDIATLGDALSNMRSYLQSLDHSILHIRQGELSSSRFNEDVHDPLRRDVLLLSTLIQEYSDEYAELYNSIMRGDLCRRIEGMKYAGIWRTKATQMNGILELCAKTIKEATEICRAAQNGDFNTRILDSRTGMFEELRIALNGAMEAHRRIVKELSLNLKATRIARDEAKVAAQAKNQVLAHVSEETQSLIKQILSSAGGMRVGMDAQAFQTKLSAVKKSCGMVLNLSDELRGYAQLEEGKIEVSINTFNLRRFLFEIKDIMRPHIMKRGQDLSLVIDPDVPEEVIGDVSLLESSLLSILTQSVHYTEEDGSISFRAQLVEKTNDTFTVAFTCTDSGGGAFASRREQALTTFQANTSESTQEYRGGGLSMIITKRVVQLIGGSLTIESRLGLGFQYQITIPLLNPSKGDTVIVAHQAEFPEDVLNGPKVLIVEDDIINQRVAVQMLKDQGFHTTVARDGLEALRLLNERKFNLILMDINLPVLDGLETAKRIRNSQFPYATIPIIAVTANPLRIEDEGAPVKDFNGFLLKPLESRALREVLRSLSIDTDSIEKAQMI